MKRMMKHTMTICAVALALVLAPDALSQGRSESAPGKNRNLGHGNASNGVMAIIHANRHVLYAGDDALELSVRFPRGADLLKEGEGGEESEVDAHLVFFGPDAIWGDLPLDNEAADADGSGNLFQLAENEIEALTPGVYQLGVVLTVPGGSPYILEDWYNGMLGLVAVKGLTVAEGPIEEDADGDGFVDADSDADGLLDGDDETGAADEGTGNGTADGSGDSTQE